MNTETAELKNRQPRKRKGEGWTLVTLIAGGALIITTIFLYFFK